MIYAFENMVICFLVKSATVADGLEEKFAHNLYQVPAVVPDSG